MSTRDWAVALGLLLLIEGVLPLLAPGAWRATFQRILALRDGQIRFVGLAAVAAGTLVLLAA